MPDSKRATLTDVAQRAGVSVTTASYVLNGQSAQMRISTETEQRVREAMHRLDYRPNRLARNLRGSSTQTIGLISDHIASGEFASQLLSGASSAARDCDHLLVIGETLGDLDVERLLIQEMLDRQVDGLIYATRSASRLHPPERLVAGRTVLLNCTAPDLTLPAIVPDDEAGGRAAVEHLLARGVAGSIHVVGEDPTTEATAGVDRLRGITSALDAGGACLAGIVPCAWDVAPAYDAVDAWLAGGARPGALICMNDRVAMGAYEALDEHRLAVPGDVAVISFDGSDLASWLRPSLSSLAIPFAAMGKLAVEVLMGSGWPRAETTRLPLVLQPGESTA